MLETLSDTVKDLVDAAAQLENDALSKSQLDKIIARGAFRPAEDEAIGFWFARFLSARESLWAVMQEVLSVLDKSSTLSDAQMERRYGDLPTSCRGRRNASP